MFSSEEGWRCPFVHNSNSSQRGQLWAGVHVCVCVCVCVCVYVCYINVQLLVESRCGFFPSMVTAEQDHSDICTKLTWQKEGEENKMEGESKAFAVALALLLSSLSFSASTETRNTVHCMACELSRIKLEMQLHGQFTFYLSFNLKG